MITELINDYTKENLGKKINDHIRIALTDHISFAIEREKQGIHSKNKLLTEIKVLYKKEFAIGRWAVRLMEEKLNMKIAIDEAAPIALYVYVMKIQEGDLSDVVRQTNLA